MEEGLGKPGMRDSRRWQGPRQGWGQGEGRQPSQLTFPSSPSFFNEKLVFTLKRRFPASDLGKF